MILWVQFALVLVFSAGFVVGYPSLNCPESSSSRWCEVHSNQQIWPPMVSSSPKADGWAVGKFALSTKQGLTGSDAICGQDVGGSPWWASTSVQASCLPNFTRQKVLSSSIKTTGIVLVTIQRQNHVATGSSYLGDARSWAQQ